MQKLGLNEIREKFLNFFESKDHLVLPSFSLVPKDDPSILLNNAGMTPMKKWFTREEEPPSLRIATCQKCIRTPDIDNVGYTARHGTFFEMLGNFSFNDYFKEDAIKWAWEFVHEVLEIPYERLAVSVYESDDEAYDIWHDIMGLPAEKIFRLGKEDNFWEHGVGPCGPCSEIFVDRGEEHGCGKPNCEVGCECDRFVEVWNLVFTQFKRLEDGSYEELSSKNIDTGAGLERFAMVMQDVDNLFEVDTVRAIIDAVAKKAKRKYHNNDSTDVSLRVVTDHIRSTVFMLADGVRPSNEGRGYVLRRLIRRAAARGLLLDISEPFLCDIAEVAIKLSKSAYPELEDRKKEILKELAAEEQSFRNAVEHALPSLKELIATAKEKHEPIPGSELFKLHDSYGLPIDLSGEIAENYGVQIDRAGFDEAMARQKERARRNHLDNLSSAWTSMVLPAAVQQSNKTKFLGYDEELIATEAKLQFILEQVDDELVEREKTEPNKQYYLIFDETPFYAEAGGQIGDTGEILAKDQLVAEVQDCQKKNGYYLHQTFAVGELIRGQQYTLAIHAQRRLDIMRNHTATHLLHAALRQILGPEAEQRGSLVHPDYLRFDFSSRRGLTPEELGAVEDLVNEEILKNTDIHTEEMPLEDALEMGALALFGEKYDSLVRVMKVADFSVELCGGTHLDNSAKTGLFHILSENGIASGVRRIFAVTGEKALDYKREQREQNRTISALLGVRESDICRKLEELVQEKVELEKQYKKLKQAQNKDLGLSLLDDIQEIKGLKVLLAPVEDLAAKELRELSDQLVQRGELDFLLLVSAIDGKVLLLAKASNSAIDSGYKAGELVRMAAQELGGSGGGKPDYAQAGGKNPKAIPEAIAKVRSALEA
ncbi:MAG: alanine--tRNA ligase [Eubacteriales bacterium]|nr:alanine--tRNA ligase [Eubacteriales bacterium]